MNAFYSGTNQYDGKEITWPRIIDHGDWWEMDMSFTRADEIKEIEKRRKLRNKRKRK